MSELQEAFREAARREFAMVPPEHELDYTFSPGFQRRMRRLIRAQAHGYWWLVDTTAKRVACIAAIMLTTALAIRPVRERVIKFFVEIYEEYFEITFGEEESGDLDPIPEDMDRYTLSWVPDGYYTSEFHQYNALLNTIWKAEGSSDISLVQGEGTHRVTLDHSNNNLSEFMHKQLKISIQTVGNASTYIWEQHGYIFHLTVYNDIPTNSILHMIESLTEVK